MAIVVVDCAAILAWALEEQTPETSLPVLERVASHGAIVPGIWPLEIGNALIIALRQRRLTSERFDKVLANIKELRIEMDKQTNHFAFSRILSLARRHRLTTYDAAYLELAARSGLPLATYDRELAVAANDEGVLVLAA
jgi:predicted nucleic acid-binding protein